MKKVLVCVLVLMMAVPLLVTAAGPSEWAKSEIDTYADAFLTAESGELNYRGNITREQFAVLMFYMYNAVSPVEIPSMTTENPFTDCNNPLVVASYGLGLIKGVSETEFNPGASITREQIATIIERLASGWVDLENLQDSFDFKDKADISDWAMNGVGFCTAAGLIKGTDENKIEPKGNCTVEQALIIAKRIREKL